MNQRVESLSDLQVRGMAKWENHKLEPRLGLADAWNKHKLSTIISQGSRSSGNSRVASSPKRAPSRSRRCLNLDLGLEDQKELCPAI